MIVDPTAIIVAAIAAFPASVIALAQWRKARNDTDIIEAVGCLSGELRSHAEDDAAFQEWIIGRMENGGSITFESET